MKNDNKKVPHSKSNPLKFNVTEPSLLMDFLMKKLDGISRNKVKRMLANKVISVNGDRTTQFDFALEPGMVVEIGKPTAKERFRSPWLNIVYEDKYLLVIDKKEGLLTNSPTKEKDTAQSILNDYFIYTQQRCRAHTIHRLDRDTSGLMLFAKSKEVALRFEEDWKNTVYDRRYVAVVCGCMEKKEGMVASWLKDNKAFITYSSPTDNGGKYILWSSCSWRLAARTKSVSTWPTSGIPWWETQNTALRQAQGPMTIRWEGSACTLTSSASTILTRKRIWNLRRRSQVYLNVPSLS